MKVYLMNEDELIEERQRTIDAAREVLETPAGQIVLEQLKQKSGFYLSNFSTDALEMAYREGQRSVVLYLLNLVAEEKVQQTEGE